MKPIQHPVNAEAYAESLMKDVKVIFATVDAGERLCRSTQDFARAAAACGRMYGRWLRLSFEMHKSAARLLVQGEPKAALRRALGLDLFETFDENERTT